MLTRNLLLRIESGKEVLENGRHEKRNQSETKQLHGGKRRQEPGSQAPKSRSGFDQAMKNVAKGMLKG